MKENGEKAVKGAAKVLFFICQWTWGLPVNAIGALLYLAVYRKCRHGRFCNAFITYVPWKFGGVSLGQFIFMADHGREPWTSDTRIHEYGHTIQCLLLGPLYWFIVGAPSFVWCTFLEKFRRKRGISYYRLYCEAWANLWGEKWSGRKRSDTDK